MESKENIDPTPSWKFWHNRRRYIINFLMLMGTAIMYTMRINLSVAIVSMTDATTGDFDWNSKQQGLVLGSFFYGYFMTMLPGGIIAKYFPAHHVFGFAIGSCAILTLITPIFTFDYISLMVIRIIEGVSLGAVMPSTMGIFAKWSPVSERTRMTMICNSGTYFGTVIAMSGAGVLSEYYGWQSVFYVFGGIGVVYFVVWMLVVKESPEKDPWISEEERRYIMEGTKNDSTVDTKIPWVALFTAIPVWAIVFAHFTLNWGAYTLMTQMPTFLSDTMNLKLSSNGFYSALPYLTAGAMSFIAGFMADFLRNKMKLLYVRKLFTSGAFLIQCCCMLAAGFVMVPAASITFLTVGIAIGSIGMAGFASNFLDLAPQYSSIIFGFTNTFGTIPGIVSPLLTGYLVQNKTKEEWRHVFYISASIYVIGAVLYGILGSTQPLFPKSSAEPPKYSEQDPQKGEKTYVWSVHEKNSQ